MRNPTEHLGITQAFKLGKHNGIDIGWHKIQTAKLYALFDGECIYKKTQRTGGLVIHVYSKELNMTFEFGHLSKSLIKVGDKVKKGQYIANMGNSGEYYDSKKKKWVQVPYHLHLGLCIGKITYTSKDKWVNPVTFICVYKNQTISAKTSLLYSINKTKIVKGVPSEPLNVRNSDNKVVYGFKNGQEVEYFGKTGDKAIVDKVLNYTTIAKYLK